MKKYVSEERLKLFWDQVKAKIPTKLSQLQNDDNFVKDASYVHTDSNYTAEEKEKLKRIDPEANKYTLPAATKALLGGVKIGANITVSTDGTISVEALSWENISGKPTNVSVFNNDAGYITKAVSDLTNYYKKAEVYTKSEVTALIGDIKTISIEKVDKLPSTGQTNVIYLVPSSNTSTSNSYTEYIWVAADNKFESIGDTQIDLSNYWNKTELTECTEADILAIFETA